MSVRGTPAPLDTSRRPGRKRIAIVQSNYIPWRGYFDLIRRVDEFVLFDEVQYTRRDWRNRNRIKTAQGVCWLTIPVAVKGRYTQKISETLVSESSWRERHWRTLSMAYGRAPFFRSLRERFEELYLGSDEERLSRINERFLRAVCELLGLTTRLKRSSDYEIVAGKSERLVSICRQADATEYYSGPAARAYLDEDAFRRAGIEVRWMVYPEYRPYRQQHGPAFERGLSIVDLLFNEGPECERFLAASGE